MTLSSISAIFILFASLITVSSVERHLRKDDDKPVAPSKYLINAKAGKFLGQDLYGARAWRGIRYGTAQRWMDSVPVPKSDSIQEQFEFGAACWQPTLDPVGYSEDCLFLNVYAPGAESKIKKGYPVFVFIHGGGLISGTSSEYEAVGVTWALLNEVVVVTINYRLNVFGFFKPSAIANGHFGFRDQQLALKWVKQNIAAFGGDPDRVTLSGQSAGARSTQLHTLSPGSTGLFQQAILISTPMKDNFISSESAAVMANAFSSYLGCSNNDLACLRSLPSESIVEGAYFGYFPSHEDYLNMNYYWYGIVLDSADFPFSSLFEALPAINSVPTMTGVTWNEGLLLFSPISDDLKHDEGYYKKVLEYLSTGVNPEDQSPGQFSTRAQQLHDMYPFNRNYAFSSYYPNRYDGYDETVVDTNYLLAMMYHDVSYYCSIREYNRAVLSVSSGKKKKTPVIYSYLFSHVATCSCSDAPSQCLYTTHGDDLPFLATTNLLTKCPGTASETDIAVSLRLRSGYINFIHTGNPNTGPMASSIGPVAWPQYTPQNDEIIEIGTTNKVLPSFRSDICAFWNDRGYYHGYDIGDPFF